jgi:proline iminopeptidase
VVVHGGPGLDHRYLRPGLDGLARGRSVVYWDQRGVGRSVPATGPLDTLTLGWEANLEDLDRVADRFGDGRGRVALLAHSWGALPALAWALSRPGRVRSLVLVAPAEPGSRFAEPTRLRREARSAPLARAHLDSLLALPVERRTEPGPRSEMMRTAFRVTASDPALIDRLDLRLLPTTASNGDVVARRVMGTAGDLDLWDELGDLDVPVLVVQGSEDLAPPELAWALEDALPRGRAVLVDGAGHFPFVPGGAGFESFVAAVDSFLLRSPSR